MFELNEKVKNLTPYEPISGEYEIRLDANESFLTVPENIAGEMAEALKKTVLNRYPDPTASKVMSAMCQQLFVWHSQAEQTHRTFLPSPHFWARTQ